MLRSIPLLPYCPLYLNAPRPKPYPENPATLGEHLRRRRLQSKLLQRDAAKAIGVSVFTLLSWEKGRAEPEVRYWPATLHFLGYDPSPEPATTGEWISRERCRAGLPSKALAKLMGWDEGTLRRYETDAALLPLERKEVLEKFFRKSARHAKASSGP